MNSNTLHSMPRGVVWAFLILVAFFVFFPTYGNPKSSSIRTACLSNVKQMVLGNLQYATGYDDALPIADHWMNSLSLVESRVGDSTHDWERVFHDPTLFASGKYGYAFRREASALRLDKVDKPETYGLIFDSVFTQRNAVGGLSSLPQPGRHNGRNSVGHLDGHVKSIAMP